MLKRMILLVAVLMATKAEAGRCVSLLHDRLESEVICISTAGEYNVRYVDAATWVRVTIVPYDYDEISEEWLKEICKSSVSPFVPKGETSLLVVPRLKTVLNSNSHFQWWRGGWRLTYKCEGNL